jgi:hypothetical protein
MADSLKIRYEALPDGNARFHIFDDAGKDASQITMPSAYVKPDHSINYEKIASGFQQEMQTAYINMSEGHRDWRRFTEGMQIDFGKGFTEEKFTQFYEDGGLGKEDAKVIPGGTGPHGHELPDEIYEGSLNPNLFAKEHAKNLMDAVFAANGLPESSYPLNVILTGTEHAYRAAPLLQQGYTPAQANARIAAIDAGWLNSDEIAVGLVDNDKIPKAKDLSSSDMKKFQGLATAVIHKPYAPNVADERLVRALGAYGALAVHLAQRDNIENRQSDEEMQEGQRINRRPVQPIRQPMTLGDVAGTITPVRRGHEVVNRFENDNLKAMFDRHWVKYCAADVREVTKKFGHLSDGEKKAPIEAIYDAAMNALGADPEPALGVDALLPRGPSPLPPGPRVLKGAIERPVPVPASINSDASRRRQTPRRSRDASAPE